LATLLLIVIAVAAISVTYAWIMTYTNSTTDKAGVMLYEVNTSFDDTANTITIDVGNSGTSDANVIAIYAGNSSTTLTSQTITSHTVTAGSYYTFTLSNMGWNSSSTVYFKVVPASGTPITFEHKAP
jgi:P pilus assembly chaperone PapD